MRLVDQQTGKVLFSQVIVARTFVQRLLGLLGSRSLAPSQAMFFRNCNSVHMLGMRFSIDVIYLDRESRVVKLVEALKPWRLSFARSAKITIEVQAGACRRLNLKPGQRLTLEEEA